MHAKIDIVQIILSNMKRKYISLFMIIAALSYSVLSVRAQTINDVQDQLVKGFQDKDWVDIYNEIISNGSKLPHLDEKYKSEDNLVDGCSCRLWIHVEMIEGSLYYSADTEPLIIRGLLYYLIEVFSGHTAEEIYNSDIYFVEKSGFNEHLAPTRYKDYQTIVRHMKKCAKQNIVPYLP